jgi:hypothetical protein
MGAIAGKEIRYLFRETYFKMMLANVALFLGMGILMFLLPHYSGSEDWLDVGIGVWVVTSYVFMGECQVLFNIFGNESTAAATLFLFPGSRREILVGKSVVTLGAILLVNVVVVAILCAFIGSYHLFGPVLAWVELATLVSAGAGNVISVLAPLATVRRGWRLQQPSPGRGCGYGLLYALVFGIVLGLSLPVLAAALIPSYWAGAAWFALTIPLAAAYAVGIYMLSLRVAGPLLREREFDVIRSLTQQEK